MLVPTKVIRTTARAALKNKMVSCMAATVGFLFCVFSGLFVCDILSYITKSMAVSLALNILFVVFAVLPVLFGLLRYMWFVLSGITQNPIQIFYYFSSGERFGRAANLSARLVIKGSLWAFVCFLPAFVVSVLLNSSFYEAVGISIPEFIGNLWVLEVFLAVAGLIGWVFLMLRYYLAPFLFVADEKMPAFTVMDTAKVLSKRTMLDYVCLVFSMFVWVLISLTGMPIIFTLPYFLMAYLVHGCYAVAQYNSTITAINTQKFTVSA